MNVAQSKWWKSCTNDLMNDLIQMTSNRSQQHWSGVWAAVYWLRLFVHPSKPAFCRLSCSYGSTVHGFKQVGAKTGPWWSLSQILTIKMQTAVTYKGKRCQERVFMVTHPHTPDVGVPHDDFLLLFPSLTAVSSSFFFDKQPQLDKKPHQTCSSYFTSASLCVCACVCRCSEEK